MDNTGLRTVIVETASELAALRQQWIELLGCQVNTTMFMTPDWLETWWKVFGEERRLQVVRVNDDQQLVGLGLFTMRPIRRHGLRTHTRLEVLGTGEEEAEEVGTEYPDLIALPGKERAVAVAIAGALHKIAPDEVILTSLLEDSLCVRYLVPTMEKMSYRLLRSPSGQRYRIELPSSFSEYLNRLSKKKAKRVLYYRRRLEREGRFKMVRVQHEDQLEGAFQELERLHTLRWNSKGKDGAFSRPRFRSFHNQVARRALAADQLGLRVWHLDDRPVAAHYHFHVGDTVYYYQSGFDTDALGNMSGGLVTLSTCIEEAIRDGFAYFDFMRAADGTYKEDYGCETAPMVDLALYRPNLKGRSMFLKRNASRVLGGLARRVRSTAG
jgi:CelD/BcsL family acetyltransferase involved in cellulose biosynthesis